MSRIVNDIDVITQLLGQGLNMMIGSLFTLIGIIIAMFVLDYRLSLASLSVVPVLVVMTQVFCHHGTPHTAKPANPLVTSLRTFKKKLPE